MSRWSVVLFPLLTLVPAWAGVAGVQRGVEHRILIAGSIGASLLLQLVLERLLPYRRDWGERSRPARDALFLGLSAATGALIDLALVSQVYEAAARLASRGWLVWPRGWGLGWQVALAVLLGDLGHYWAHRALHDVPSLWRFHRMHHGPDHLHALNFFRMHPLEITLKTAANVAPLILLGAPRDVLAVWTILSGVSAGSVNHCNVAMDTRPWDLFFSTPSLHRFHHSSDPRERGNLGNITTLYDWLFGTLRLPRGGHVKEVGL